eukprot:CAMPEP_0173399016 /NCGR_PEP_ID=MMETSP1356-20130122/43691_1 /TAXON_ID=77927 ORGANISM="Hemiselmis virescens, Strain PCC157" /NCGR_SAMPLE_ID=MMETSP1356 /ASSEMBLY_ACC=CAM_ASM_000847 /LENGTH=312 /DNA_ID=CAMNT_0014358639 /DNA_START=6 /DNA_END=941 /DNA_ORIENTATION=+
MRGLRVLFRASAAAPTQPFSAAHPSVTPRGMKSTTVAIVTRSPRRSLEGLRGAARRLPSLFPSLQRPLSTSVPTAGVLVIRAGSTLPCSAAALNCLPRTLWTNSAPRFLKPQYHAALRAPHPPNEFVQPSGSRPCSSPAAGEAQGSGSVQPPVVGMPRYPDGTPMGILRGLDYGGTIVFACTGSITAASTGMDVFGCMILGTITAVGGGTLRDVLVLGKRPFWSDGEPEYFSMSLAAAALAFFIWPTLEEMGMQDSDPVIFFADAIGVGAFCVIGVKNGLRHGMHWVICLACGVMTATFGGLVRDTLAKRPA